MPLPLTVSCFSKIQIGFTFPVPAHPGSPGKGPLNGCMLQSSYLNSKGVRRILVRGVNASLPPEAKKILKI